MWVDCDDETIIWISKGQIQIERQRYAVGPVEDSYHLRCICVGCPMDQAYCQRTHQIRIADSAYDTLRKKAKAASLKDDDVIRFKEPFTLSDGSKCDTFRLGHLTHGVRRNGRTQRQTSTVFYAVGTNALCRITHWQRLDWENASLPVAQQESPQSI